MARPIYRTAKTFKSVANEQRGHLCVLVTGGTNLTDKEPEEHLGTGGKIRKTLQMMS